MHEQVFETGACLHALKVTESDSADLSKICVAMDSLAVHAALKRSLSFAKLAVAVTMCL
jgi:hypothetical protein